MGLCLSTDSYTNLFQRSPLWWENQTLKKCLTIEVKKDKHTNKHWSSVGGFCSIGLSLCCCSYHEHPRLCRRQFVHLRCENFYTTCRRRISQLSARTPDCLLSPLGLNWQSWAETTPPGAQSSLHPPVCRPDSGQTWPSSPWWRRAVSEKAGGSSSLVVTTRFTS